jgi:hypothetical protein
MNWISLTVKQLILITLARKHHPHINASHTSSSRCLLTTDYNAKCYLWYLWRCTDEKTTPGWARGVGVTIRNLPYNEFFFPLEDGVGLVSKRECLLSLACYVFPVWYEFGERRWNNILTGENRRTRRKTCPSATFSTTNPTWIDPGLRDEMVATKGLSHCTALSWIFTYVSTSTTLVLGVVCIILNLGRLHMTIIMCNPDIITECSFSTFCSEILYGAKRWSFTLSKTCFKYEIMENVWCWKYVFSQFVFFIVVEI